jgi:hypothetical protein
MDHRLQLTKAAQKGDTQRGRRERREREKREREREREREEFSIARKRAHFGRSVTLTEAGVARIKVKYCSRQYLFGCQKKFLKTKKKNFLSFIELFKKKIQKACIKWLQFLLLLPNSDVSITQVKKIPRHLTYSLNIYCTLSMSKIV